MKKRLSLNIIFCFLLIPALILTDSGIVFGMGSSTQNPSPSPPKKVVVLLLDELGLSDLGNRDFPNLYRIVREGGLGLAFLRTRSSLFSGESVWEETYADTLKTTANQNLHVAHLMISASTDTLRTTIDGEETIDLSEISEDRGPDVIFSQISQAIRRNDIIFIDYRFDHQEADQTPALMDLRQTLIKADHLLGNLFNQAKGKNMTLILLPTKSSVNRLSFGNKRLSPVILFERGNPPGILTSVATRRKGLIVSGDILPTIFTSFSTKLNDAGLSGIGVRIVPDKNNLETLLKNLNRYGNLKSLRYVTHAVYSGFIFAALILFFPFFIKRRFSWQARLARLFGIASLAFPAFIFLLSVFIPPGRCPPVMIIMGALTLATAYLFSRDSRTTLDTLGIFSILTLVYLLAIPLLRSNLLLWNPLGFVDIFAGGRFFGINNDCMGILIGSTGLSLFYLFEKCIHRRWAQLLTGLIGFGLVILSLTPLFGSNVGGSICAMATGTLVLASCVSERLIRKKRLIFLVVLVLLAEFFIAYLDYRFGTVTSHAGKAMGQLLHHSGGTPIFGILRSKLLLFLAMLFIPPWNILLAGQLIAYWSSRKSLVAEHDSLSAQYPYLIRLFPVLFYGSLVAFIFNDTGVIAAGIILIYLTMPLGVLLQTTPVEKDFSAMARPRWANTTCEKP